MNTFVYKIEYDAITSQFIVTQPSSSFLSFARAKETVIEVADFKMLSKEKLEEYKDQGIYGNCVYYNGRTGRMFATVGRGTWYN